MQQAYDSMKQLRLVLIDTFYAINIDLLIQVIK